VSPGLINICLGLNAKHTTGKKPKVHVDASQTTISPGAGMDNTGPDRVDEVNQCSKHIQERLCKLEQLFERFVCRKNATTAPAITVPHSPTLTASGSSEKESKPDMSGNPSDAYSISSLGDGIVSRILFVMSLALTLPARSAHMDISTFYPYVGRQIRYKRAVRRL
jgi:hypothetical protein